MNRRRLLAILGAVLLTVFGTIVLVAYVSSAERRAQQGAELVGILVAREEIPAGTSVGDVKGLVARREVPSSVRAEDAVTNLDDLGRQVTVERILQNEPIVARQFGDAAAAQRSGGGQLSEGLEVITLALEPQRALGGELAQGDLVGVLVSMDSAATTDTQSDEASGASDDATTAMILAGVRVAGVSGADPEADQAGTNVLVTLEVDQTDAEKIAFGAEYGRIWLTRQAEDEPGVDSDGQTRRKLFKNLRDQSP